LRRDVSERGSVSRSTSEHSKPRPINVKAFCPTKRLRVTDPRSARITALAGIARLTFISAVTVTLTTEQEQFIAGHLKEGRYRSANDVVTRSPGVSHHQLAFFPCFPVRSAFSFRPQFETLN
jgi:hypothetical protein